MGTKIVDKEYINQTVLSPFAALILAACVIYLLTCKRRNAVWPFVIIACFIPQAQRIVIGGLDFMFLRVLVVFAGIRVLAYEEYKGFKFLSIDWAVLTFAIVRVVWGTIFNDGPAAPGVPPEPHNMAKYGTLMEMMGMYFFFRFTVRDFDDLRAATKAFMWAAIFVCIGFIYEASSGKNPFAFMRGGESDAVRERDGVLRVVGAFSHPILAGVFWAALLPYMGASIKRNGRIHYLPLVAIACSGVTILLTGSSSPVMSAGVAFVGGCLFLVRDRIRMIRWGVFVFLVLLQIVMARGAAHILSRITIFGSSTGYYRFLLIDQFVKNWQDWIVKGSKTGTENWNIPMYDIVNYYVILGLGGGITALILIAWVFNRAYKHAGRAVASAGNTEDQLWGWATGVSVCVHMISFLVVTYFGQIQMVWYFALAATAVRGLGNNQRNNSLMGMFGRHNDPLRQLASQSRPGNWPPPVNWNRV